MAVSNSPKTSSPPASTFIEELSQYAPDVTFVNGKTFLWSPKNRRVLYVEQALNTKKGQWSLLHELSHALLEHNNYKNDFELLQFEVAAWQQARKLASELDIEIDQNFVEDCLDTYRDWLHQRSTCPTCGQGGLQHDSRTYRCHNCLSEWQVSQSRFCRPYRMKRT